MSVSSDWMCYTHAISKCGRFLVTLALSPVRVAKFRNLLVREGTRRKSEEFKERMNVFISAKDDTEGRKDSVERPDWDQ